MTYKQINTSREIRQWIGLCTTTIMAIVTVYETYPQVRVKAKRCCEIIKDKTQMMFKKKEC